MGRFASPIEPDRRNYRIRLSDKTSRLRPRRAAAKLGQAYEPEVPVKVREWISSALAELSPNLGDGLRDQAAAVWDCEDAGLAATSIPSVNLTP